MLRRWSPSLLALALAVAAAFRYGVVALIVGVVVAALVSPRAFPRSVSHASAVAAGGPIVYWRPGCPYCMRLRAALGRDARRLRWVDIWTDPEAAAAVRAVAGGNETVPTVVFPDRSYVNPEPSLIRARLRPAP